MLLGKYKTPPVAAVTGGGGSDEHQDKDLSVVTMMSRRMKKTARGESAANDRPTQSFPVTNMHGDTIFFKTKGDHKK